MVHKLSEFRFAGIATMGGGAPLYVGHMFLAIVVLKCLVSENRGSAQ